MKHTIYWIQAILHNQEIVFGVYSTKIEYAIELAKKMFLNTHNIELKDGEFKISIYGEEQ